MAKIAFIFHFFNLYSTLAFRKESMQLPGSEDKSTHDVNLKGSRDGKRKFKIPFDSLEHDKTF